MARGRSLSTDIVLEKAFALANANGIDSVTYNGLARELDIRPQSLYRYVKDLKELRVSLLSKFLYELTDKLAQSMRGCPPAEALRIFAIKMYDECHSNPRYYESFALMHRYDIVPNLRKPLLALGNLVQSPMEQLKGETEECARATQLFVAVNLGYAQMAMTEFIPTSLYDNREAFIISINEFVKKMIVENE